MEDLLCRIIEDCRRRYGIPGISVAYVADQKIYTVTAGYRSLDTKATVNGETVFAAASLGKPVLAHLTMQLVERGRFSLDRPLHTYCTYADVANQPGYVKVTARSVLAHTSGLPNARGLNDLTIPATTGSQFRYSGEGYWWLQKVITNMLGRSLDDLVGEYIFQPLGMARSSYTWQPIFDDNHAIPHDRSLVPEPKRRYRFPEAHNSLQTTAQDYGRFLREIINPQLLSRRQWQRMLSPQVNLSRTLFGRNTVDWSLGFGLQSSGKSRELWHWGNLGGERSYVVCNPDQKIGFVFFTNSANGLECLPRIARATFGTSQPGYRYNLFHLREPYKRIKARLWPVHRRKS